MSEQNALLDPKQVKENLKEKIRQEVANLIPEETIIQLIDETKDEFLRNVKDEAIKEIKKQYEAIIQKCIGELSFQDTEVTDTVRTVLQSHIKKSGMEEMSLLMNQASRNAIDRLVNELRNQGFNLHYNSMY